jgi:hypothetical protein
MEGKRYSYPLTFLIDEEFASDGSASELNTSKQGYEVTTSKFLGPLRLFYGSVSNDVSSTDTDLFSASGSFLGPSNASSTQTYKTSDTLGHCYGRKLVSAANKLTAADNVSCH